MKISFLYCYIIFYMGLRFRKQIKLGKLLKLNVSKSGVSFTAGKSGASVNVSKTGVYANVNPSIVGVKKTGVSFRQKLFGFSKPKEIKEKEVKTQENPLILEALAALKELGYKNEEIKSVKPKLYELSFDNSSDYLKEALKLLKQ